MEPFDWRKAAEGWSGRAQDFQDLMRQRVQDIILVSSPYDSFILEEDGQLYELILSEFLDLDLRHTPGVRRVSTGAEALALASEQTRYNLIITTPHVGDMSVAALARQAKRHSPAIPVVLLAYDQRELVDFTARNETADIDGMFLWQGDARILLAIVKFIEDRLNLEHDARTWGVQVIIVIEDDVRSYSSFLPVIYTEVLLHSHRLISEGVNLPHKIMRMRARPKILLCRNWEEAWGFFTAYEKEILGIISDVEFPRGDRLFKEAGVEFARKVKELEPDVPIALHSSRPENEAAAREIGAAFLLKGSPTLLNELRRFMVDNFAFGDFVFRMPDGSEVARVSDLRGLEEQLHTVPPESIAYHAARNHFSNWLKARTEFALAYQLRPRKLSDYASHEDVRRMLIESIAGYRRGRGQQIIADFDRKNLDAGGTFARVGTGSLGGKARGLAFVRQLISRCRVKEAFPAVQVTVPASIVIGTDVFDRFLDENDLRDFAIHSPDDEEIRRRFLAAPFPRDISRDLAAFLGVHGQPLAVRSSSLLEDSQYQPFTGVYETYMLDNNEPGLKDRLERLVEAVKLVYASTFSQHAKAYLRVTPYRLEEEKMAVIVQRLVGAVHGERFYPDFAGVARSHNFYPTPPLASGDGIAAVALGLGRTVVAGGNCMRFCPRYPRHLLQFSSVQDVLRNSQREFFAIDMGRRTRGEAAGAEERTFGLDVAEADGTLAALGSTWSRENDAIYDGLSREGVRLVSFAPILKHDVFPLAGIVNLLLEIGAWGMSSAVEIEFAGNLSALEGRPAELGLLQMRPLALTRELEELEIADEDASRLICRSSNVLGNGKVDGIHDIVVVDFHRFERSSSLEAAQAVTRLNAILSEEGAPYLLIGVGRWGSADPWLGIPVAWEQISAARVIVEAGFRDFRVTPSQGSHFFHNLTSFNVGYFTVNPDSGEGFVDWEWLAAQTALTEADSVRHLRLSEPIVVKMNGRRNAGLIYKPGAGAGT